MYQSTNPDFIASELEASRKREQEALRDLEAILHPPKQHFFEEEFEKNMEEDVYYAILTSKNPRFYLESMAKRYGVSIETIEDYGNRVFQRRHGQSFEDVRFQQILDRIAEIKKLPDSGRQMWELQKLAKKHKRTVRELTAVYDAALQNQPLFELLDAVDVLQAAPDKFDWLVAGLLPMATTALLYAEGGTGKTLLANSIIKAVACGSNWNGFPTLHGKVLLMQTDEPAIVTAQNLKIAQFTESLQPGQLLVNYSWQFSQMQQLRDAIAAHQAVLVVIDSLTSSNRTATAEEKDVEYGRCLYELRDIAMEFGACILVLHHENKTGGVRGSTAIKANVSEVWHLTRDNRLAPTQRLLDVEKSRSGCSGLFQLQLDVDDYSWQHQGDFDPTQAGCDATSRPAASLPLKARLLAFLEERPGVPFEVEELVGEFGSNRETIRKTLDRLWRSGLVQFEERIKPNNNGKNGQTRYKVYLAPDLSQRLEPSQGQGLVAGTTLDVSLGQDVCPNDNLPVVPVTNAAPNQDSASLGQTELVTGTTPEVSLGQPPCPNDKLPVVPTTKPAPSQDSVSLGQNGSRTPPSEKISFKVGVRVVIVMPGSRYEGQTGMVRRVFTEHGLTLCTVQLDGTRARVDYRAEYLKPAL